mmetsp:Transcript_35452/g.88449  ORF Transcript_35452/g.88449 Transcript_35452/m.88449 type:complete len:258 (-) Transcript_35452:12-785(-)
MSQPLQVYPDLVSPAGPWRAKHDGCVRRAVGAQPDELGGGGFALWVHAVGAHAREHLAAQRCIDDVHAIGKLAIHKRYVALGDLRVAELRTELPRGARGAAKDEQAGGLAVEPVNHEEAGEPRGAQRFALVGEDGDDCVVREAAGCVHGDGGWLIDDHQLRAQVQDPLAGGRGTHGRLRAQSVVLKHVALAEDGRLLARLAVDQNAPLSERTLQVGGCGLRGELAGHHVKDAPAQPAPLRVRLEDVRVRQHAPEPVR